VNDRLYPAGSREVNDLQRDTAEFLDGFAGQPDLAHLGDAARRVLATAAALFYERGAAGTSVRDVTAACRLSPGALYNHFSSKDDLLYTLVQHGLTRMRKRLDETLADCGPAPTERFVAFVRGYVVGHLTAPKLAQVTRREYLHLSPGRCEEVVGRRREFRTQLTQILLAGAKDGSFELIGGRGGATGQALMVLDMCSRTSEWYDPHGPADIGELTDRYIAAARRLVGA
jgi:AcrR family transcriptional regulator